MEEEETVKTSRSQAGCWCSVGNGGGFDRSGGSGWGENEYQNRKYLVNVN